MEYIFYIEYEFFLFTNYRLRDKIRRFNLNSLNVVLNIQFENSLEKIEEDLELFFNR